ncbi:MAG: hypothetical protein DLM52_07980 [Chthoniobacterales bacterium]|nr:MAG: hypothetical protein DLM52_07980 [Chthoniobacterales bacterium]
MDASWYLCKHEDRSLFGPLPFDQLVRWAASARIAPQDLVSPDQETWMKAPMLAELGMDWLVEVTSERYYGPTTLGAVQEFVRLGEVTPDHFVINACDGMRQRINEMESRFSAPAEEANGAGGESPAATRIAINFEERIRDLERSLHEERRALKESEARYRELEARYQQLLVAAPEAS